MIAILTDSTCDIPLALLERLGISMVPLDVHLGGCTLQDWREIEPEAVYRALGRGETVSTGPVSTERFSQRYRELLAEYSGVLSLHISGGFQTRCATPAPPRARGLGKPGASLGNRRVVCAAGERGFARAAGRSSGAGTARYCPV
ncbi:DegV family protein [Deinococcus lacus]|uniref:DegV family protein n=1 Tax=Deinococcus lacus TaxID=392561 RepID=A0ABW1Y9R4_9DEIO